jgi:FkbM family methyltransferase
MKQFIRNMLIIISSNVWAQKLLEHLVIISEYLMGIGAGSSTGTSGEQALADKLKQFASLDQHVCVFDVGSNKGQFLDLVLRSVGSIPIHIHAFEPAHETYKSLCANAKGYSNVTLNNIALGNLKGESSLFYDYAGSGLASLTNRRLEHLGIDFKCSEKIIVDTLDNYCSNQAIQEIDLLKLDVEGHELDVLQGAKEMLAARKIKMVSFEFGGCDIDTRIFFRDFYYFFQEYGMQAIFRITPSGCLVPVQQYKEVYEQFRTTNYLVMLTGDM